jgi:uncharacterized protein YodC (DUF2158 family)
MVDHPEDAAPKQSDSSLKAGDQVWLKSGSPALTVRDESLWGVDVVWMNGSALNEARFPAACLTKSPTSN